MRLSFLNSMSEQALAWLTEHSFVLAYAEVVEFAAHPGQLPSPAGVRAPTPFIRIGRCALIRRRLKVKA